MNPWGLVGVAVMIGSLFLTPLLFHLPTAVLAATIIVAVLSLVDLGALRRTWAFSRFDFGARAGTIGVTLTSRKMSSTMPSPSACSISTLSG